METIQKDFEWNGKVALITGIGGQDGSYLAEFLLSKGYKVRGMIRRSSYPNTKRIDHLDIYDDVYGKTPESPFYLLYGDLSDSTSIRNILEEVQPDEVYNLASQSHVSVSFNSPESTLNFNAIGPLRILEAIRNMKLSCKYYQASSSEMYGISPPPQNEETPMIPQSPYGISKLAAFHLTRMYRNAYGLYATNGILFNHESPRRGVNFVTRKITRGLAYILTGRKEKLSLGNLDAKRDWGYAKEYVEAMWLMLQQDKPDDYVIGTKESHTVKEFVEEAFNLVNLNWKDFVEILDRYKRPAEVPTLLADSSKAERVLGWKPKTKFKDLVKIMVAADLKEAMQETGYLHVNDMNMPDDFYIEKGKELAKGIKLKRKRI
ncbi:MAG: GDP-mannose 4,6-dehydratase [Candidatus Parcubacteria bacterium]|nr:MAG: GDP-mannose 4,6-dehydratase [Candidatus Pacearchaeota archaeon]GIW65350.1 MAG: GDP-mannose 4,6-dehydratase [Candidatus Parcubacteria bacterium]